MHPNTLKAMELLQNALDEAFRLLSEAPEDQEGAGSNPPGFTGRLRRTLIPEDWQIPMSVYYWRDDKYPGLDLEVYREGFIDWHRANGRMYTDWGAAFKNWVRRSIKWGDRSSQGKLNLGMSIPVGNDFVEGESKLE
jgi:hypothetical protein